MRGVEELIPIVMNGSPGPDLVKVVEDKVLELLKCQLPFNVNEILSKLGAADNECLVQLWMCPSKENCGKEGDTPTGRYCKDIDHVALQGLFLFI